MKQVYRDGKVHVCARMCKTCIFRPGNLMHLEEGRVEEMVRKATSDPAGSITCHSTIGKEQAICRGFFEKHGGPLLTWASYLHAIEYVEPPGGES